MTKIINENFEKTGYEESWTETVTSGNTCNEDSIIPGVPPIGAGVQCLNAIVIAGASSSYAQQIKSNTNINYVRFYLYISQEGLNDTQFGDILVIRDSSSAYCCGIRLGQNSGVLQIKYQYYSSGATQSTSWVNVNLNQWYLVEFQYDITNLLYEWRLNGVSQANGSLASTIKTPNRMRIGFEGHNGAATSSIFEDLVVWDNANWVGPEQRRIRGMGITRASE